MSTLLRDRRRFLFGAGAGLLALTAGAAPTSPTESAEAAPDGSASKDMITPDAQRAIDKGLAWLAGAQEANGSFGERTQYQGNLAVTSLAGLAFMAGGHQPGRDQYGRNVLKALEFVMSKEDKTTYKGFLHNPAGPTHGAMYSHGFATLFLAEVHGMIPDRALQRNVRDLLVRAVERIEKSQNDEGGWRYQPYPSQADVSVTICQIMALRAARNAGLAVKKSVVDKCTEYVQKCQSEDGGFRYFQSVGSSAFARSAAGVCALYCAGVYKGEHVQRGLKYLLKYKPGVPLSRREIPDVHYFYGQYYAAQAMWTAGGRYWQEWFPAIREELLTRMKPRFDGCWPDSATCNSYGTAMACIILQIPNNYLPILQK